MNILEIPQDDIVMSFSFFENTQILLHWSLLTNFLHNPVLNVKRLLSPYLNDRSLDFLLWLHVQFFPRDDCQIISENCIASASEKLPVYLSAA